MKSCDVIVIGSGPGGYVAAIRAAQRGMNTLVIERWEVGGVCLNTGCIPTKALIHAAELYHNIGRAKDFGIDVPAPALNIPNMMKFKDGVVRRNKNGVKTLFKTNGIELVQGEAQVAEPGLVRVGDEEIKAKSIIVATGGAPAQIPGLEFDGKLVIGSTEALKLDRIPKRVAVLGAGALGSEFACIWNAFGAKVTLLELMPTVLPREDEELSEKLKALMKKRGIDVRTGTVVKKLMRKGQTAHLELEGDSPEPLDVDLVLVGIGLKCNSEVVEGIKGIELTKRGGIVVNDKMETGVPGVYAIGDVVDRTWLAHGASAEGIVAAENAAGANKKLDYRVVPACNFTMPELAGVGMTEKKAREAGIDVKVGRFNYIANGRAQTLGEPDGMIKIVGDAKTDEVVGVHILGAQAGELIATGAVAMAMEATADELAHTVYTHPTLAECIKEAAEDYRGESIHTPPRKR